MEPEVAASSPSLSGDPAGERMRPTVERHCKLVDLEAQTATARALPFV